MDCSSRKIKPPTPKGGERKISPVLKMKRFKALIFFFTSTVFSTLFSQTLWSIREYGTNATPWTWITFAGTILTFILVLSLSTLTFVFWKSGRVRKLLKKNNSEVNWTNEKLESNGKQVFLNVQYALNNNNLDSVRHFVTEKLFNHLSSNTNKLIESEKIKYIDIKILELIGVEDFKNDLNDKYSIYIEGVITHFKIQDNNNTETNRKKKHKNEFSCICHFIRFDNEWKLDLINDSIKFGDVFNSKIWVEK